MKKLLFTLMLMVVGFAALAQENVTPQEMVRENYNLCFAENNKAITDVELQQLLGEDIYGSYCSGRSLYKVGNGLKNGGWAAFGGGLGMMAVGTGLLLSAHETENEGTKNGGAVVLYLGMLTFINGNMLIPTGYVLRGIGAGKISRIADDYNLNNKKTAISCRFSPAIIPVNVPQSQGNMAYGMTFSVNF